MRGWIGFFVMGLSAMGLLVEHEPRGLLFMLAAALFGLAIWVRRRRLQAHVVATAGKTWSRQGPRTMTIDGTGIASAGAGYASSLAWSMVTDVIKVGPHTVMVFSPYEFVAIPDAALPVSLTPEAFLVRIADWRARATT